MGNFSYICKVIEQNGQKNAFRGNNDSDINSHEEICKSEFDMDDSLKNCPDRIVNGERITFRMFSMLKEWDCIDRSVILSDKRDIELRNIRKTDKDNFLPACYKLFQTYPLAIEKPASGIVAWHKKCYDEATEDEKKDYTPSKQDPNEGHGEVREEFK